MLACIRFFIVYFMEGTTISDLMINGQIRDKEVRVISESGEQLGIMSAMEAQKLADEAGLDLVKIAPTAKPPVCRIVDYGKFKYEQARKEKEAKKKQKVTEIKEIRLSTFIEEHDIQVKANTAMKFLKDGDKVKVSIRFRGREQGYASTGLAAMQKFAEIVSDYGVIEKQPVFEGRNVHVIVAPKQNK